VKSKQETIFPKESDEFEHSKMCLCCPASLSECWNNIGETLVESPREYLKIEIRLYQFYMVFPLGKGKRRCVFAVRVFSEQRGK
jgi:hypothetical protein